MLDKTCTLYLHKVSQKRVHVILVARLCQYINYQHVNWYFYSEKNDELILKQDENVEFILDHHKLV